MDRSSQSIRSKLEINVRFLNCQYVSESDFPYFNYCLYSFIIITPDKQWNIQRRYSNFDSLHSKLKNQLKNLPKFPVKRFFNTECVIKERKHLLTRYLKHLLNRGDIYKFNEIFEFVEMEKEYYLILKNKHEYDTLNESKQSTNASLATFLQRKSPFVEEDVILEEKFYFEEENKSVFSSSHLENAKNLKMLIYTFLKLLSERLDEKCSLIKQFYEKFQKKKEHLKLSKNECFKLLYGEKSKDNNCFYHGLLFHCGNIQQNLLGAELCIEFLAKLVDYELNHDCDIVINTLKLAKISYIKMMSLEIHLKRNKPRVVLSIFKILSTFITNEEKCLTVEQIIHNKMYRKNFNHWYSCLGK
jgi:hypothetical protein